MKTQMIKILVSFGFAVLVFAGVGATYVSPTASDDYVDVAVGCYEGITPRRPAVIKGK